MSGDLVIFTGGDVYTLSGADQSSFEHAKIFDFDLFTISQSGGDGAEELLDKIFRLLS